MNRHKIIFILPSLEGGGAERVILTIIRHLNSDTFEPYLFLFRNTGVYWSELPESLRTIAVLNKPGRISTNLPLLLWEFYKFGRGASLVVGSVELGTTYFAALAGMIVRAPVCGWIHIDPSRFLKTRSWIHRILIRIFYSYLKSVICVSNGVSEEMQRMFPYLSNKLKRFYNPVEVDQVRTLAIEDQTGRSIPKVVAVGRLCYQKGFDILIKASAILHDAGLTHNLMIIGEGEDRSKLHDLAVELGINQYVQMPGFLTDPFSEMKNSDVFVLSSRFEGFGLVIVEALALGVPVVSTDCPTGPSEILSGGEYGLLVPPEDPASLAQAIHTVITDNHIASTLTKMGSQRATEFAPSQIVIQIESHFHEIIEWSSPSTNNYGC